MDAITPNDVVTTVAALLSAVVFPFLRNQAKEFKEEQKRQMDALVEQNKKLQEQLAGITERLFNTLEKKVGGD